MRDGKLANVPREDGGRVEWSLPWLLAWAHGNCGSEVAPAAPRGRPRYRNATSCTTRGCVESGREDLNLLPPAPEGGHLPSLNERCVDGNGLTREQRDHRRSECLPFRSDRAECGTNSPPAGTGWKDQFQYSANLTDSRLSGSVLGRISRVSHAFATACRVSRDSHTSTKVSPAEVATLPSRC